LCELAALAEVWEERAGAVMWARHCSVHPGLPRGGFGVGILVQRAQFDETEADEVFASFSDKLVARSRSSFNKNLDPRL